MPSRRAGQDRYRAVGRWLQRWLLPDQRLKLTPEGRGYLAIWLVLMLIGIYQQSNLILLVAGLAAGPMAASVFVSAGMLRRVQIERRAPRFVFEGTPLSIDYRLENQRRITAALALSVEDRLRAVERAVAGTETVAAGLTFARVPGRSLRKLRWQGQSPVRGRYRFESLELISRAPFGLMERTRIIPRKDELIVYPRVGRLTRRWHLQFRESSETKRGRRHDRTVQQQEYHGLRDYRPGDSPRWIHWRTTARLGQPMVKEFEQQSEQDVAILLDPWLPRTRVSPENRAALEQAIQFAATVCLEVCRQQGRRLTVGWTGPTPGVRGGLASTKLLHELLSQLAVLRSSAEGQLSALLDALPAATLRESLLVVVSTRSIQLSEEFERAGRFAGKSGRGLASRVLFLDAAKGDLNPLFELDRPEELTRRVKHIDSEAGAGTGSKLESKEKTDNDGAGQP